MEKRPFDRVYEKGSEMRYPKEKKNEKSYYVCIINGTRHNNVVVVAIVMVVIVGLFFLSISSSLDVYAFIYSFWYRRNVFLFLFIVIVDSFGTSLDHLLVSLFIISNRFSCVFLFFFFLFIRFLTQYNLE